MLNSTMQSATSTLLDVAHFFSSEFGIPASTERKFRYANHAASVDAALANAAAERNADMDARVVLALSLIENDPAVSIGKRCSASWTRSGRTTS